MKNFPHGKLLQIVLCCFLLHSSFCLRAWGQGTAFTYQGRLNDGSGPANGIYDLRFTIYDSTNSPGNVIAGPLTNSATGVSNGLFTVTVDFGNVFPGSNRWLEIAARTNGGGTFTTLSPRQLLTPTPYAITAGNVVSGGIPAGTYGNAVAFSNNANTFNGTFSGNGANLANVNAATLGALAASSFWQLGGNTVSSGQFLGSMNNRPVVIRVNNQQVMQLAYASNGVSGYSPNVMSGNFINSIATGVVGGTVGGGGRTDINGVLSPNLVNADFGAISGGASNVVSSSGAYAFIGGGQGNTVSQGLAAIGGGYENTVGNAFAFIGGGYQNNASGPETTVAGGALNTASGFGSTAAGGGNNVASGSYSTIVGGLSNNATGSYAIAGGFLSQASGDYSVAVGTSTASGTNSTALGNSSATNGYATAAGYQSVAGGYASTAMGDNLVASGDGSIAMGYQSHASGFASTAMGFRSDASGYVSTAMGNATANGRYSTAMGNSTASGDYSTALGVSNAKGPYSTAMGNTTATGTNSTTMGYYCFASGYDSVAAGIGAFANTDFTFVWSDGNDPTYPGFSSTAPSQFLIHANGGVGIGLNNPAAALHVASTTTGTPQVQITQNNSSDGVRLRMNVSGNNFWEMDVTSGSSPQLQFWYAGAAGPRMTVDTSGNVYAAGIYTSSDRNLKENFNAVSPLEVLDKVAALPITRWNFKQDTNIAHVGPMAQDFRAAFGLGTDDKHIATVDEEGVALAAIQGLNQKLEQNLEQKETEITELKQNVAEFKKMLQLLAEKK